MWEIIAYLVVAIIAVALVPTPKGEVPKPASLNDIEAPTAEPGRPIPVVFGTMLLKSPNVVWYGDLYYTPVYV